MYFTQDFYTSVILGHLLFTCTLKREKFKKLAEKLFLDALPALWHYRIVTLAPKCYRCCSFRFSTMGYCSANVLISLIILWNKCPSPSIICYSTKIPTLTCILLCCWSQDLHAIVSMHYAPKKILRTAPVQLFSELTHSESTLYLQVIETIKLHIVTDW